MANYDKQTWVARVAVGDNIYEDQNGNTYEFTPAPTSVTTVGTAFSASRMNHMENGIASANNPTQVLGGWTYTVGTKASAFSIAECWRVGGVVTLRLSITTNQSIASEGTYTSKIDVFADGCKPKMTISSTSYSGTSILWASLLTSGTFTVHNIGSSAIPSGTTSNFTFTYVGE